MCGLAGLWTSAPASADELRSRAERMTTPILHRGPDDAGVWTHPAGVAFGFRRLSIVDLSALGHQPMTSAHGRFTVVFNGEVYNHAALRRELEAGGAAFRGHSDTEVILAAYERWGVEDATRRMVGMFAMAVWDHAERRLHLVRDRLGIKPLFVFHRPGFLAFGSELKALLALDEVDRELDPAALTRYLRLLYVPAPATIFARTQKLRPGHILTIGDPSAPLPPARPFWSLEDVARRGMADPWRGDDAETVAEAERLLREAVGLRMIADVPLGAFLSGGIDSSTVVALMQEMSDRPVQTFTIGFTERDYDESAHAAAIAAHLGTDHTAITVTPAEVEAVVPSLAEMFDEPLADPSGIPTFLVSQLARRTVTVALSGDGGDELFGGYNRYVTGESALRTAGLLPGPARRLVASMIGGASPRTWNRLGRGLGTVLPGPFRDPRLGEKFYKLRTLAGAQGPAHMYRALVSCWQEPCDLVVGGREGESGLEGAWNTLAHGSTLERMMLADQAEYLPDDLLAKVDRASMAVSLEARVPILDHRVVEFSWRLPRRFKIRDRRGKWVLRRVLARRVPDVLVDRPKMGFSVPIDGWLRGPLREWAEDLLAPGRLRREGILEPGPIRHAWEEFQAGRGAGGMGLWAVLMFQAWQDRWSASSREPTRRPGAVEVSV